MTPGPAPVHVVHLVYSFSAGGLENVIVQLIDSLPSAVYRHTVVALTAVDPVFAARIQRTDVELVSLHKPPGQPFVLYPRMYRLLRRLRPDVLHSCNLAALEFVPVALLAGVPRRIHAEHGWDMADPDGSNRYFQFLRRLYTPFAQRVVAVSKPIAQYLVDVVGLPTSKVVLIENGVDTQRFRPRQAADPDPEGFPFTAGQHWVIGTIGRLENIKNQRLLVEAFVALVRADPDTSMRLAIIGAGPLAQELQAALTAAGCDHMAWLPGVRSDVPEILRRFDCFVLPSLAEGTSCTLQEAMATGLEIVATDVGGNAQVLADGAAGRLVVSADVQALIDGIRAVQRSPGQHGVQALQRVHRLYAKGMMVDQYEDLFSAGAPRV